MLLVLAVAVALAFSWLATEMRKTRDEKKQRSVSSSRDGEVFTTMNFVSTATLSRVHRGQRGCDSYWERVF